MYSNCDECDFNLERYKGLLEESNRNYRNACETIQQIQAIVGDGVLERVKELKEKASALDTLINGRMTT